MFMWLSLWSDLFYIWYEDSLVFCFIYNWEPKGLVFYMFLLCVFFSVLVFWMLLRMKWQIFVSIVLLVLVLVSLRLHFRFAGRLQDFVGDVLWSLCGRQEGREEWLCTLLETCGTSPRLPCWYSFFNLLFVYTMYAYKLSCCGEGEYDIMFVSLFYKCLSACTLKSFLVLYFFFFCFVLFVCIFALQGDSKTLLVTFCEASVADESEEKNECARFLRLVEQVLDFLHDILS